MEFKSGKRHQLITDQFVNSNKIYANRYNGLLGVWYFVIDCIYHFENFLAVVLFFLVMLSEKYNDVSVSFPVVTLSVNITLMAIRNVTFELRQRKITNKINNKMLEFLMITAKFKRFQPITWADIKPGYIIKVRSGQEFPSDCLILDIQGTNGSTSQKCYVTSGPFDDATGII
jgi:magnesium-transporting ATPase (P-type)